MQITILNKATANPCNVFPASSGQGGASGGDKINALSQNTAYSLAASTTAPTIFYCFTTGVWQTK
jgi:Na+/H+ antiporter NhaC